MKSSLAKIAALLSLMVLVACKPSVPSEYIQPNQMEEILYDYHLSQAIAQRDRSSADTTAFYKNMYYYSVLKNHNVTEAEFDSSMVYYYTNADILHDIYRNISERMNNVAKAHGASSGEIGKYSQYKTDGDTANIWQDIVATSLTPYPTNNRFDFIIEADSTYKKGDTFLFNLMATFMYQSGTKDATVFIAVRYNNDSINTYSRKLSVSGLMQMRIPAYKESDIKNIKGFIYLNKGMDDSKTLKLLFIDKIQMIRFHPQDEKDKASNGRDKSEKSALPTTRINPLDMRGMKVK